MKKIRSLQILVYLVFGSFVLRAVAIGALQGLKEGYGDALSMNDDSFRQGTAINTVINGNYLTNTTNGELKIGDKYILENVRIMGDMRVNHNKVDTPYIAVALKWILILGITIMAGMVAYNINRVIKKISDGSMFDRDCIKLISNVGALLTFLSLADYAYQQLSYLEQSQLIQAPLRVINTTAFDYSSFICAILAFIIAEAFKQGARLKEEQSLVI